MIAQAKSRWHRNPAQEQPWAELGAAYLQQAEITGDPTYYPLAQGALLRSPALDPANNWRAMSALATLANTRRDFTQALGWARQAADVNAYNAGIHGAMVEALTHLGDYPAAAVAVQKVLESRPGTAAFIQVSEYFAELDDLAFDGGTRRPRCGSTRSGCWSARTPMRCSPAGPEPRWRWAGGQRRCTTPGP